MNLEDDDSLLSGYLDGELDPAQREAVEAALAGDPELAARLADLEALRRQLGGLARPLAPRDVTANVLAHLRRDPRARARTALRRHPRLAWGGLAAAAAALALLASQPPGFGLGLRRPGAGAIPAGGHRGFAPLTADAGGPGPAPAALPAASASAEGLAAEFAAERERDRVRALLDRPGVRRLVVVVDEITSQTLTSAEDALAATPRVERLQGRLRIGQGIAPDPDRPGEALVYTVVLDDHELGNLQTQLERRLATAEVGRSAEPAAPELVTQLADVGQILVSEGPPAAPSLVEPPALPGPAVADRAGSPDLIPNADLAAEAARGPHVEAARPAAEAPAERPRRVTLVWITTRPPGGRAGGSM
jgi:hypothetical protein